jgi:hypothetical protein
MGARFTIKYNGAAETASMSDANCARLLEREVRGCAFSTGGKHTYDDWFFELASIVLISARIAMLTQK